MSRAALGRVGPATLQWMSRSLAELRVYGELRVLLAALTISITAVSAVGLFTDRVDRGLQAEARTLQGGDLLVDSRTAIPDEWIERAREVGLASSVAARLPSVVYGVDDLAQLAAIRAVDDHWPLRGEALIVPAGSAGADPIATSGAPPPGHAWLDSNLMSSIGISPGDRVEVGELDLQVAAELRNEPDQGTAGPLVFAPRLMMNLADLEASGLIGFGSRVRYQLTLTGEPDALTRWRDALELEPGQGVVELEESNPALAAALERARQFLALAALLAVVLGATAIAITAHHFASRQADTAAVMRALGATSRQIWMHYIRLFAALLTLATLPGIALGIAAQQVLGSILGALFEAELPGIALAGLGPAFAVGLLATLGFAFPALYRIVQAPPLRVLRSDAAPLPRSMLLITLAAIAGLTGMLLLQTGDFALTVVTLGGFGIAVFVLLLVGWSLVAALSPLRHRGGLAVRYGLANLARRRALTVAQLTAFTLGLTALLLLGVVRSDLFDTWDASIAADAPNHYVLNIQDGDRTRFVDAFRDQLGLEAELEPMIGGRLAAINDDPVEPTTYDARDQRLLEREFNLSFRNEPAAHNPLVVGEWMAADTPGWSVEQDLAKRFGLSLGDELTFSVAGRDIRAPIANLRAVEWESFQVNFFVIGTPAMLDGLPQNWIAALRIPPEQAGDKNRILRDFPTVTAVDIDRIIERIRDTVDRASRAVELVFLFSLAAGIAVLLAAAQVTRNLRLREGALLRTLGASRATVWRIQLAEFLLLGVLAGGLSAIFAAALGATLAFRILDLAYYGSIGLFVAGLLAGLAGIGAVGIAVTRTVARQPPLLILRGQD